MNVLAATLVVGVHLILGVHARSGMAFAIVGQCLCSCVRVCC